MSAQRRPERRPGQTARFLKSHQIEAEYVHHALEMLYIRPFAYPETNGILDTARVFPCCSPMAEKLPPGHRIRFGVVFTWDPKKAVANLRKHR